MAAPAAPTIRVRNRPSLGIVEVTITAVSGALTYQLYRDTHAGATTARGSAVSSLATPVYDAASVSTSYWYRAKATNADGTSAFGPEVHIKSAGYTRSAPGNTDGTGARRIVRTFQ